MHDLIIRWNFTLWTLEKVWGSQLSADRIQLQSVFSFIQIQKRKVNISYWYDFTYKKALVTLEQGMLDSAETDG